MSNGWLALIVLWLLLLFKGEVKVTERRYTLSAHKYNEDTGRPQAMGIYKTEDIWTHAEQTARTMLDTTPEATLIEVYDHTTQTYNHVTRL